MRISLRLLKSRAAAITALLASCLLLPPAAAMAAGDAGTMMRTRAVFLILLENHNWEDIQGSTKAPFLNSLLAQGAYATRYMGVPGLHPSEPNYIWLLSGNAFRIANDAEPAANGLSGRDNLASQLMARSLPWRSYQEGIDGRDCPLKSRLPYVTKHNPFVFYGQLTDQFSATSPTCIAHNRPFSELQADLAAGKPMAFAFITPDECNDMHGHPICRQDHPDYDPVRQGDAWLSRTVPMIQASEAYRHDGLIIITWDESEGRQDRPIGLILLSPNIRPGYVHTGPLTHGAVLRTVENVYGLPPLGDAARSPDLADFFR